MYRDSYGMIQALKGSGKNTTPNRLKPQDSFLWCCFIIKAAFLSLCPWSNWARPTLWTEKTKILRIHKTGPRVYQNNPSIKTINLISRGCFWEWMKSEKKHQTILNEPSELQWEFFFRRDFWKLKSSEEWHHVGACMVPLTCRVFWVGKRARVVDHPFFFVVGCA